MKRIAVLFLLLTVYCSLLTIAGCSGGGKDKPIEERDGFLYQPGGRYEVVEKYVVNPSDGYLYATTFTNGARQAFTVPIH